MTEKTTCKKCGNALPTNAPAGVCPRCLLQAGLLESSPEMNRSQNDATILTDSAAPYGRAIDLSTVGEGASSKNIPEPGEKSRPDLGQRSRITVMKLVRVRSPNHPSP